MLEKEMRPEMVPGRRERVLIAAGVLVLAVIPILLTPFPPSTDLPQHIAQVRLFKEALADPRGPYVIQWLAPNNLIYVFLLAFWTVLPVGLIARAALILIVCLWIAAIHGLGAGRKRAPAAAVLASFLIFNQCFYWGFLNFLIGFPVFVLWFALTTRAPEHSSWKNWAGLVGTTFLLYGSHALWFAAGGAWLVLISLMKRVPLKYFILRLASFLPCGLASLLWYPSLSAARAMAGYDVAPHWFILFDRLGSFINAAFGGVHGPLETAVFIFIYLWIGFSVWQNRSRLRNVVDRDLLAAAGFFGAIVLVAPDKYMDTIFFSSRWLPPAMIFLLLAVPSPSLRRRAAKTVIAGVTAVFFLATAFAWLKYDREDLSGFRDCLERIPASSRVLGLDLIKDSEYIKGRPFLQLFAYAQVYKGGELNFSFAENYSGLVAYGGKRDVRWSPMLEWFGETVKRSDFAYFDFVLANGEEKDHQTLAFFKELRLLPGQGRWRLYEVKKP
jgi:hypothetical protein